MPRNYFAAEFSTTTTATVEEEPTVAVKETTVTVKTVILPVKVKSI